MGNEEETAEEIEGETETEDIDDVEEEEEEEEEEENEEVDEEETIEMEDNEEEELVVVHGEMHRVSGHHWMASAVLLILTGTALTVLFMHLLQRFNSKKMENTDPEYTPLIAD